MTLPRNTFGRPGGGAAGYIHWSRLIVWAGALLLAFLAGFAFGSGGSGGVSKQAYDRIRRERDSAENDVAKMKAAQSELQVAGTDAESPASPAATPTPAPAPTDSTESREYVTKADDTWWKIAKKFYGEGSLYTVILDANSLTKESTLRVGMTLIIPPKPQPTADPSPTESP